jgi:hypothetical protein
MYGRTTAFEVHGLWSEIGYGPSLYLFSFTVDITADS